jgi:hypothetical protein
MAKYALSHRSKQARTYVQGNPCHIDSRMKEELSVRPDSARLWQYHVMCFRCVLIGLPCDTPLMSLWGGRL